MTANVSHFELLFKAQAPVPPQGTAAVDRVIQGYFLELTNLEANDYLFTIEFVVTPPPAGTPDRGLANNTLVFVDSPGNAATPDDAGGVLVDVGAGKVFASNKGAIPVPAGATALIAVLPAAFMTPLDPTPLTSPDFEVRGYVRIRLPALLPKRIALFTVPQSTKSVNVLLTPQHRATFLNAAGAITGQVQASLPLAGGSAAVSVDPDPGRVIVFAPFESVQKGVGRNLSRAEALASALAGLEADSAELTEFNRQLAAEGVKFSVEPRGR